MAATIQALFITPAVAVARLGGSTTPLHAYDWVNAERPRYDGETELAPSWTLAVRPDGSVDPFLPDSIAFRDGDQIRPVAPFFEVWARLGEPGSRASTWTETPLTPELLAEHGLSLPSLRLTVSARNLKAARRTGNPAHAFGTWQELVVLGNAHGVHVLEGRSPPQVPIPMIPRDRHIPMGTVQMLRSVEQPQDRPWSRSVRVDAIRFRYTPPKGTFYGPPLAASAQPGLDRPAPAVPVANAFLDPQAGWSGEPSGPFVVPRDTYDVIDQREPMGSSLGVVDDTSEVHFNVSLQLTSSSVLTARAVSFVAPPDFAPDRRPFLSVADELNDRDGTAAARNAALSGLALDAWVEDLFERIYETVSLFNVDHYREGRAAELPADRVQLRDLDSGARPQPERAMGGRDALRSQVFALSASSPNNPLPLSEHARMRHRALSDIQNLVALLTQDALAGRNRIAEIVRAPFEVEGFEDAGSSSMRMPPFMRQSNALPLTLASWQYDLLIRWVEETRQRVAAAGGGASAGAALAAGRPLSHGAALRRKAVLARLDAAGRQ